MEKEIIYFELGSLQPLLDYPDEDPFLSWMGYYDPTMLPIMLDSPWCKQHKICVKSSIENGAFRFKITATKDWVNRMCPRLLQFYTDFVVENPEPGEFLEYTEENFGVKEV